MVAEHETVRHAPVWERLPYEAARRGGRQRRSATSSASTRHTSSITAAAPIHPDLIRWFHAIGLPVIELYGQTEVCGPTTCNPPEDNRIGTVGPPIPGVRVRIADDGEILVKGGNVCHRLLPGSRPHRRA